jgi:hypothetical protein
VACVLHARHREIFEDCIGSVGKQAGDESGKYPVNEEDEEICCACTREARLHRGRSYEFQFTLTCFVVIACDKREAFAKRERSDEAIHLSFVPHDGLLRFAGNDGRN